MKMTCFSRRNVSTGCNRVLSSLTAVMLLAATRELVAQTYDITDLGTLGGDTSQASGINNLGQVVGTSFDGNSYVLQDCGYRCTKSGWVDCTQWRWRCYGFGNPEQRAFLWTPDTPNGTAGTIADLGTLGGPQAFGVAINQAGEVVGNSYRHNSVTISTCCDENGYPYSFEYYDSYGFSWTPGGQNGKMTDLDTFLPTGINSSGQIIGNTGLWQDGSLTNLGFIPHGLNDLGQVVGESGHAMLWQQGSVTDLGTLVGGTASAANGINTNGQVVGISSGTGGRDRAFLFTIDSFGTVTARRDLGSVTGTSNSWPHSINNPGQVVGESFNWGESGRPFLWDNIGAIRDLNSLIPPDSGWVLNYASAINDAGQIVGTGVNPGGYSHAFLLTPVPATAPRLTVAARLSQLHFVLLGEPARSYTIQASTNLANWTAVTNFVSATRTNQFTDTTAPNFNRRFYRAVTP